MREAVIVSTVRTPIGKAYRGAFNDTTTPTMAAPVIQAAISRAKVEAGEIDDLIMGAALQEGTQGYNVARQCGIAAGLPVSVSGQTIDRQCSSGLMSISMAAKQIVADGMQTVVAGGLESISLVQNDHQNEYRSEDAQALEKGPGPVYGHDRHRRSRLEALYDISREAQDEYALQSQQRTADGPAGRTLR